MKNLKLIFFLCCCLSLTAVFAQTVNNTQQPTPNLNASEISSKLDELLTRYEMYGFSGSVIFVRNDKIVLNKGYGFADVGSRKANTGKTLFDVGSIAKTFTAAVILQLEMAGNLKTDDFISKYLGEFPNDKTGVRIHHLLTHTAGFNLDAQDAGITPMNNKEEFLQKAKDAPLLFPPGERYSYSNLGYGLWQ